MDQHLREHERRWRTTRSTDDELAFAVALERRGRTDPDRRAVAALLGNDVARLLTEEGDHVSNRKIARLASVSPETVNKWGRTRGCPRVSAKAVGLQGAGKFAYSLWSTLDWRRDHVAYVGDGLNACNLLVGAVSEHSLEAVERIGIAALWASTLELDVAACDRALELLPQIEAALPTPRAQRPALCRAPRTRHMELGDFQIPQVEGALLRAAAESLGFGTSETTASEAALATVLRGEYEATVAVREKGLGLQRAVAYAFWSVVAFYRRGKDHDGWDYSDPDMKRDLQAAFDRIHAQVVHDVVPWALGFCDPVAERVARRAEGDDALPELAAVDQRADRRWGRGSPSDKQRAFIESLRAERKLDDVSFTALLADTTGATNLDALSRSKTSVLIEALLELPKGGAPSPRPVLRTTRRTAPPAPTQTAPTQTARLNVSGSEKRDFEGTVRAVQPRISRTEVGGEPKHGYQGYVLTLEGEVGGEVGRFAVGLGKAAQAKHAFRVGDRVSGKAAPVGKTDAADLHKASGLKVLERGEASSSGGPPWHDLAPELTDYRARGYLALSNPAEDCASCVHGCWLRLDDEARLLPVCYGPRDCPHAP